MSKGWPTCSVCWRHRAHETVARPTRGRKRYPDRPQPGEKWQLGAWLDDAGSKASGRYQAGGALYLYDLTTLNDILYLSGGGDIEFNQHNDGNHNGSLYYSIPFGYWTLSAYGAYSQYRQQFNGNWSTMDYKSKNRYYSATLSRLLSHTWQQKPPPTCGSPRAPRIITSAAVSYW